MERFLSIRVIHPIIIAHPNSHKLKTDHFFIIRFIRPDHGRTRVTMVSVSLLSPRRR